MTREMTAEHDSKSDALSQHRDFSVAAPLLEINDLTVDVGGKRKVRVLNGVSYAVTAGETLAVIGESGCGKSMTARAVMGILPPTAIVTGGSVRLHGVDTLASSSSVKSSAKSRQLRGTRIGMIFQDSLSALNPVLTVGYQVAEVFRVHRGLGRRQARQLAVEALDSVKIPSAAKRVDYYPHQFSGGMRQRAMIAMALAMDPDVLIADEPTTALDVTVQAQIMELLKELQESRQMGLVLITHDLGVVAEAADNVVVMYAGKIVERAPARDIYPDPRHPYTQGLLASIPRRGDRATPLSILPGTPPDPAHLPAGCPFGPRCKYRIEHCRQEPPMFEIDATRESACYREESVK